MKERIPALVAVALLFVLVGGTWWAADYTRRSVHLEAPRRITHEPDAWSSNFVMVRTDPQGMAVNRMEGQYMRHYPDDDSYHITTVKAVGQQAGAPITVGTSKTAVMDQDGSRITMQGDAHLHRKADKDRAALDVTSDTLILLPDEDVAYTDLPATVVNGKSTMHGKGMRYDNKTRTLQVYSASDVKISSEDSQSASRSRNARQPDKQP